MSMLRNLVVGVNWLERCLDEAEAEVARGGEWAVPQVEQLQAQIAECKGEIRRLTEWSLAETMARFGP